MPASNYPSGFAGGVTVRGIPLLTMHPGKVFWVHSGTGSNGNKGTFDRPFSTVDYAVGQCTADKGDIIMVKPGHVETVTAAGGLDLDVAGIALVGLGAGSLRPTINFTTAVGADMDVDAANITMVNFLFTGGIDALTGPIDVNAADFTMLDCTTRDVTGQATDFIVADAGATRLRLVRWTHEGATAAGADTALTFAGATGVEVIDCRIDGNFAVGCIENTAAGSCRIYGTGYGCYMRTRNAADIAVTLHASTTGEIGPDINITLQDNAANITECLVGAAAHFFLGINVVNLAGEASMTWNGTASTDA